MPGSRLPWNDPNPGTSRWSDEEASLEAAAKQSAESSVMHPLLEAEPVSASRINFMTFGTFGKGKKPEYQVLDDQEEGTEAEEETSL
jgi:hypothetical protein